MDETGRENQEEVEENISRCDFLTTLLSFKLYFVTLITLWKIANGGTLIFFFFFWKMRAVLQEEITWLLLKPHGLSNGPGQRAGGKACNKCKKRSRRNFIKGRTL